MKKNLLFLIGIGLMTLVLTGAVSAQYNQTEKRINVVSGKKLIIKGAVRDTDEISYVFMARAGQKLTVKVIGRDADFTIFAIHAFDAEQIAEDTQLWSKTLPDLVDGKCSITVHSNYKVADYRLEILLGK
jgi:hypothetical protein